MSIDVISDTHHSTTRLDIHVVARELTELLGPTLVAVLADVRDRKLPNKWALPDGPVPRVESMRRLQIAHRTWKALAGTESDHVVRAWFIGLNPRLGEVSPVEALHDGRLRDVLAAAEAFARDTTSGS